MKVIKVIYNAESEFILRVVEKITSKHILELYRTDYHKDKKKSREILERHGTKNLPLIVFENENLDEYAAIWSEQNPDWEKEINIKLNENGKEV